MNQLITNTIDNISKTRVDTERNIETENNDNNAQLNDQTEASLQFETPTESNTALKAENAALSKALNVKMQGTPWWEYASYEIPFTVALENDALAHANVGLTNELTKLKNELTKLKSQYGDLSAEKEEVDLKYQCVNGNISSSFEFH